MGAALSVAGVPGTRRTCHTRRTVPTRQRLRLQRQGCQRDCCAGQRPRTARWHRQETPRPRTRRRPACWKQGPFPPASMCDLSGPLGQCRQSRRLCKFCDAVFRWRWCGTPTCSFLKTSRTKWLPFCALSSAVPCTSCPAPAKALTRARPRSPDAPTTSTRMGGFLCACVLEASPLFKGFIATRS